LDLVWKIGGLCKTTAFHKNSRLDFQDWKTRMWLKTS
jgi:hypothetical protein